MSEAIKPFIQHLAQVMRDSKSDRDVEESLEILQLYHSVRELVNYVVQHLPSER